MGRRTSRSNVAPATRYIYNMNHTANVHEALATSNPRSGSCQRLLQAPWERRRGLGPAGAAGAEGACTDLRSAPLSPNVEVVNDNSRRIFNKLSGLGTLFPAHLPVLALPFSHVFGRNHGPYVPERPSPSVRGCGEDRRRTSTFQAVAGAGAPHRTRPADQPSRRFPVSSGWSRSWLCWRVLVWKSALASAVDEMTRGAIAGGEVRPTDRRRTGSTTGQIEASSRNVRCRTRLPVPIG